MSDSLDLDRYRVVLVAPKIPENIGSVARLLENYAVGEGSLVDPRCEWREGVAQWMATGPSIDRLNSLPVQATLKDAVRDCQFVIGFTARSGRVRQSSIKLEEIGKLEGKIALVFGREDFCLFKEEIEECTHLCALDTSPHFPALNLSHSVAVVLSQLFNQENDQRKGSTRITSTEEQAPVFAQLREMMVLVGLTKSGNPDRMLSRVKKILQRAQLTSKDLVLLRGLISTIVKKISEKN